MLKVLMSDSFFAAVLTLCGTIVLFIIKEWIDSHSCQCAIKTELKVLKGIFESTLLREIDAAKEKGILWFRYPLGTDYFTMYNNNCNKIGKIFKSKDRERIVSSYTLAKYFLDCIRTNNKSIEYYENVVAGKVIGTLENAEFALRHSFNNNIIPTVEKLKELLKNIK